MKGIHPRNHHLRIADQAVGGEQVHLYLEMAANPDILVNEFVPTSSARSGPRPRPRSTPSAPPSSPCSSPRSGRCAFDVEVLFQMVKELPEADPRRHEVLRDLERAMDVLALDDIVGTAAAARAELAGPSPAPRTRPRTA